MDINPPSIPSFKDAFDKSICIGWIHKRSIGFTFLLSFVP
jgi:hypothetical protein